MINLTREEAQQVLDALIWTTGSQDFSETGKARVGAIKVLFPAIELLRARLSTPKPEPVAWLNNDEAVDAYALSWRRTETHDTPLYTTPPQREWQGLTKKQLLQIWGEPKNFNDMMRFARAIEAKLKEKNT